MGIERKRLTAAIVKTDNGESATGGFDAILSTPDTDRDGESIDVKSWGALPETIPVNMDHDMTTDGLIGTGTPRIEDGVVKLSVEFTDEPEAQRIRRLVNKGHIKATSVEFLRRTNTDTKGVKTTTREMIGAAVTNYPANPNAVILSSKAGARHSSADMKHIQGVHDSASALGAACSLDKSVYVSVDDSEEEVYVPPRRGYVEDVVVEGVRYILTYCIYSDGTIYPGELIADNTTETETPDDAATEKDAADSVTAPAVTDSAAETVDAKELFEFNARAALAIADAVQDKD